MCLPRINLIQRQEQCANRIHLSSVHQPIFKASSLIFNGLTAGKDMEHGTRCTSLEFFSLSAFLPLFSYRIYIHRPRTSCESNWLKPLGLSRTSWGTISDGATTRKSANVNDASWPPVLSKSVLWRRCVLFVHLFFVFVLTFVPFQLSPRSTSFLHATG
ncbi:hypothetical protein FGIG_12035 [Fasciola gigantica]|uniref:Uncharacterized protein n=1 Tax=Fasciola gigantica TaxID=46835 RepID=A0A504YDB2_FASGI|nr:hypothetical protein FGIG_12035 [Fasciola gigantica]